MEPNIPATSPDASIPPAQSLLDALNQDHAQLADLAEHLRAAWVQMQNDKVSLRIRDSMWDLACRVHQAALLADALCGRAVAETRYAALAAMPHTAVDWHEATIFADPTMPLPAPAAGDDVLADAPALPDGGSAL